MPENTQNDIVSEKLKNIPRKTLEYFVTTYTRTSYSDELEKKPINELIEVLRKHNVMSRVQEIYEETENSIQECKDNYKFFMELHDKSSKQRVSYERVLIDMDQNYMFGKAMFILLTQLGSMETSEHLYSAIAI